MSSPSPPVIISPKKQVTATAFIPVNDSLASDCNPTPLLPSLGRRPEGGIKSSQGPQVEGGQRDVGKQPTWNGTSRLKHKQGTVLRPWMGIMGRCQSFLEKVLSESQRRLSSLPPKVLGVCERSVKLESKPGKAVPTSRRQPRAVPCIITSFPKLALEVNPSYRKVLQKSEGPSPPLWTWRRFTECRNQSNE